MGTQQDDEGEAALRARLKKLSGALNKRAEASEPSQGSQPSDSGRSARAMSLGARVMTEFVAAIAVGGGLGWLFDRGFHSEPWGLIGFLFVGVAAGFWNVYRIAMAAQSQGGQGDAPGPNGKH